MRRKGFTLIELILVIAIIAILAGAMVPLINTSREAARFAKVAADLDSIKTAAVMLHSDTGKWPAAGKDGSVTGITNNTPGFTGWDGPYLDRWATDPWTFPYQIYNGTGTNQSVCSNGTDQDDDSCGTGDNATLITANRTK